MKRGLVRAAISRANALRSLIEPSSQGTRLDGVTRSFGFWLWYPSRTLPYNRSSAGKPQRHYVRCFCSSSNRRCSLRPSQTLRSPRQR